MSDNDFLIEDGVLKRCFAFGDVIIPDEVTVIGENAFKGCVGVKSVRIPPSVTVIRNNAFDLLYGVDIYYYGDVAMWCAMRINHKIGAFAVFKNLYIRGKRVDRSELVIPEGVTSIGPYAFYGCTPYSVTLPASLERIGRNAFSFAEPQVIRYGGDLSAWCGIEGLETLTREEHRLVIQGNEIKGDLSIPYGVPMISAGAFGGCKDLTSVTLPEGVTAIGDRAFYHCSSLAALRLPGTLASIGDEAFARCGELPSVDIPSEVKNLGKRAFHQCARLTDVVFRGRPNRLGNGAFEGCEKIVLPLEYVEYTETLNVRDNGNRGNKQRMIERLANLFSLKEQDLTESESQIIRRYGEELVAYAVATENVALMGRLLPVVGKINPNAVDDLVEQAAGKAEMVGMLLDHKHRTYAQEQIDAMGNEALDKIFGDDDRTLAQTEEEFSVKKGKDGWEIVAYKGICEQVSIPNKIDGVPVVRIGEYAFKGNPSLRSVDFPHSLVSIGYHAFSQCSALSSVVFPSTLTEIVDYAFFECRSLSSVVLPSSVKVIGRSAFAECGSLESVYYQGSLFDWCSLRCPYIGIGNKKTLYIDGDPLIGDVIIPDGVPAIAEWAFAGCCGITSVRLPESVLSIGEGAFVAPDLLSVSVPSGIMSIGSHVFGNKLRYNIYCGCLYVGNESDPYLILVGTGNVTHKSLKIHENCRLILPDALNGCKSETITIPDKVRFIGPKAFADCSNIRIVVLPEGLKRIADGTFSSCSRLHSIVIPRSVKKIGNFVFENTPLTAILYQGTREEWERIKKNERWDGCYASWEEKGIEGKYVVYCSDDADAFSISEKRLVRYLGKEDRVMIPPFVTYIGEEAFLQSKVKGIGLPLALERIEKRALCFCTELKDVYYPGTRSQWEGIAKGEEWHVCAFDFVLHCADGDYTKTRYGV